MVGEWSGESGVGRVSCGAVCGERACGGREVERGGLLLYSMHRILSAMACYWYEMLQVWDGMLLV